ncbi:glycosyltransferase family 4 protein [Paenibacillus hexagrammi]|uniref:Glycosyltransferase family 4 protein n=1 Tax=Paenibacillus hexagrammi TaxID=2908839 RepID=A0ABY3SM19_9BACL|nr:glycosyltransferase family 4 protein [Paenibacillus sp. YPD9-1]UJF34580.1 glycosyltransferase family 4 protein [Paenibacillus sp. YPD9-1]
MKILYLHQYFTTNSSSGGTRSYEFSKYLAENGLSVYIITGTEVDKTSNDVDENMYLYSTNTKYNNKMSKWRRIFSFLEYNLKALIKGLNFKGIDVIFATSTPLTIGLPAILISKIKRKKLIFEVRDVWPDIPIELGYITNKLIIKLLKKYELWIYNNARHIIVLSNGMYENLLNKGIKSNKISVIENMSNLYLYDKASNVEKDDFLKNKFVCIHPGTMGHVNGLDFLLDVAKITISFDDDIVFLLVGDGKYKTHLEQRIMDENLSNVIIKNSLPKNEIVKVIKSSDVGIMCVDNKYKILEDNSANKFFDFLAAGLPVLINYSGWQKEILEYTNSGKSDVTPDRMAKTIFNLKCNEDLRKVMAINSRKLAEEKYSDIIAKKD